MDCDPRRPLDLSLRFVLVGAHDIFGDRDLVGRQPLVIKGPLGVRITLTLRGSVLGALEQVCIIFMQIDLVASTHIALITHVPLQATVMPER